MKVEERNPVDFLRDILDSIDNVENFVEGFNFDELLKITKQYML